MPSIMTLRAAKSVNKQRRLCIPHEWFVCDLLTRSDTNWFQEQSRCRYHSRATIGLIDTETPTVNTPVVRFSSTLTV